MVLLEFIKENQNLIISKLSKKGITIKKVDVGNAMIGCKEVFTGRDRTCSLIEDKSKVYIEGQKELKDHTLPFRWIGIDFSFNKKRYELEIDGVIVYYSYCIL